MSFSWNLQSYSQTNTPYFLFHTGVKSAPLPPLNKGQQGPGHTS